MIYAILTCSKTSPYVLRHVLRHPQMCFAILKSYQISSNINFYAILRCCKTFPNFLRHSEIIYAILKCSMTSSNINRYPQMLSKILKCSTASWYVLWHPQMFYGILRISKCIWGWHRTSEDAIEHLRMSHKILRYLITFDLITYIVTIVNIQQHTIKVWESPKIFWGPQTLQKMCFWA